MAYTYDDFVTAATGAGLLDKFSDDDLKIAKSNPEYGLSALKLQQDLNGAKTTEQQLLAQEAINQLRTSYGILGKQAATSFQYDNQNAYQKLLDEVTNMGSFSYDAQNDPSAAALKKTYLREGERARADTLAKVSAATGGAPSSFAVTAAQQAGDYYNTQFTDKLTGLEDNAYQRYLNDFSTKLSQLGAMNADREFDFNAYLQNYEREQAVKKENYNKLISLMTGYGYRPTSEELAAAGITEAQMRSILGLDVPATTSGSVGSNSWDQAAADIQDMLRRAGYPVAVNGIWDDVTDRYYELYMKELEVKQAGSAPISGPANTLAGKKNNTVVSMR